MLPVKELERRLRDVLARLDAYAESAGLAPDDAEALDDMNAELEDALMLLAELREDDADFDEQLDDALDEIAALAGDYRALGRRAPGLDALAERLCAAVRPAKGPRE